MLDPLFDFTVERFRNKHGVTHASEPLDQDGEQAATQDSTDSLLEFVGDGNVVDVDDDDPIVIKSPCY